MIQSPETASGLLAIKVEKLTLEEEKKPQLPSSSTVLNSGVPEFRPGWTQGQLSQREPL